MFAIAALCLSLLQSSSEFEYDYDVVKVQGWTVWVQQELIDVDTLHSDVMRLLETQLWQIKRDLPPAVVARLRMVPIRMHLDREGCAGGVYHPSSGWLHQNGFPGAWTKNVEFGNAENFLAWSRQQPAMVMHELAHAWHDQVWGFENPEVEALLDRVRDSGKLHPTLYITGGEVSSYAMTNSAEFFAEMSEAWWATNDAYPFVRGEVMRDFPEVAELMQRFWAEPVTVYLLAGQSNMEGKAQVALLERQLDLPEYAERFSHLHHDGEWVERDDVWIDFLDRRGPLTVGYGSPGQIGPELGFGHFMGDHSDEAVLIVKQAWGGKSLWYDFRPTFADAPQREGFDSKHLGKYFRDSMMNTRHAMADAGKRFPELDGRPVVLGGLIWFQGWNDMIDEQATAEYAYLMAQFIRDARNWLDTPLLPVVIGQMGVDGVESSKSNHKMQKFKAAQAEAASLEEWHGSVALVPTDVYWDEVAHAAFKKGWKEHQEEWDQVGSNYPFHYLGSPRTYCDIGRAFAEAILELRGSAAR